MPVSDSTLPPPDLELVRSAQAGDERAFGVLMQTHYDAVFRLVYTIVRHEADARDVCQEVWLTVWRQLAGFRGDAKFTTWLHPIAVRRAIDHLRKRRRWYERLLPLGDPDDAALAFAPATSAQDSRDDQREERVEQFKRAMDTLPPRQRAVLALREVEGLSYEEIAAAVKIPVGTVMSRLYHARRFLAQKLGVKS